MRAPLCHQRAVLYSVHKEALEFRYFHLMAKAWMCALMLQLELLF